MAKSREAALKRAREKARLDKRPAKREKKPARQSADPEGQPVTSRHSGNGSLGSVSGMRRTR